MTTVKTGSKNCWAYWVSGTSVSVGTDIATNKNILQDRYIWLTQEGITCPAGTGIEKCKIKKETACNASKLKRMNIAVGSSSICIPGFTWEDIPKK